MPFIDCKMGNTMNTMRSRDPHREKVENISAICLPIVTMQHIRESPSASHAMRKSAWNVQDMLDQYRSMPIKILLLIQNVAQ